MQLDNQDDSILHKIEKIRQRYHQMVLKKYNYIKQCLRKYIIFMPGMKKASAILLLIIYTTAACGVSIKQFYCCGKLKSVSFAFKEDKKENCHKDREKSGCCENKYHILKVKDNHITTDNVLNPTKYFTDLHIFPSSYQSPVLTVFQQINPANPGNAPPLHYGVPVYILNCIYRI
ncbi:hypothetical protein GO495_17425 [Chitinophaga oryziterrae]|uniref:Uncharacterized protein n=1 Tax=Chitinophaga oryziterrae TaxID=1031224 RepID=A0A6N8JAV2_9BACT|nr:hypothetical protein [Chitinophaga oryziterrae]MVT42377.1 hypothetical protein [Chitinophaga oryziterrae]